MSDRADLSLPDDLQPVAERLRAERADLDGLKLDLIRTRTRTRVTASQRKAGTSSKGAFLKSRLAITMILALGILMSLSGVGLAVSGLGSDGEGAEIQYSPTSTSDDSDDSSDTLGTSGSDDPGSVDTAGQAEPSGDGSLAFTGFTTIPLLIGGVALLGSGAVLRRSSRRED